MKRIVMAALCAALAAGPAMAASPVVGTWATVAQTPQGNIPATITIAETEDGHSVEIDDGGQFGPSEITDVVVEEDSFSFVRTLDFGQGPTAVTYSGTVEGDTLSGEANVAAFGAIPISGERE